MQNCNTHIQPYKNDSSEWSVILYLINLILTTTALIDVPHKIKELFSITKIRRISLYCMITQKLKVIIVPYVTVHFMRCLQNNIHPPLL